MAGGMAFGSSFGVILTPYIGWRMLFVGVASGTLIVFELLFRYSGLLGRQVTAAILSPADVLQGYRSLLDNVRGVRTYGYVLLNSLFHSGVYTWLGVFFTRQYHLGGIGIGIALLGYGVPGFLLGPCASSR
jgi:predicted MFS family arabinose efflux permease